jgi:hypothetical protein
MEQAFVRPYARKNLFIHANKSRLFSPSSVCLHGFGKKAVLGQLARRCAARLVNLLGVLASMDSRNIVALIFDRLSVWQDSVMVRGIVSP